MILVSQIHAATRGRAAEILAACAGIDPALLDGRHHACPRCGGKDRFRWDREKEFAICNQCFREQNSDVLAAVRWFLGCSFPEALHRIAEHVGVSENGNGQNGNGTRDIVAEVARRKRIPLDAFRRFGAGVAMRGKLQVCRVPMYDQHGEQCSEFDLCTRDQKWLKGFSAKGKHSGLFLCDGRLPQPGETICVCEGVKDAAALASLGLQAVGLPTSAMKPKFARVFRGCHVVLIPDRDTAGVSGAELSAARLTGVAESVRIAVLPAELRESGGADARDILAQPGGEALLRQAIDDAVEWTLPTSTQQAASVTSNGFGPRDYSNSIATSDLGNAKLFAEMHGADVRYCFPMRKWFNWDGKRWAVDQSGQIMRRAKQVAISLFSRIDEEFAVREDIERHAVASLKADRISAMITLAQSEPGIPIQPVELDANPWYLNCSNGIIDLRTGELLPHDRAAFCTKLCPTPFDPEASIFVWHRFLEDVFGDVELIAFTQRLLGYCLTGDVSEHVLPVFWGCGSNGKSTLLEIFLSVLGSDYGMKAPQDLLLTKRQPVHPTSLADLAGKRFAAAVETEEGRRLDESLVKELTGGDSLRARRLYEDFWEFQPSHKIVLATNHKPVVRGTDLSIWRRLRLVPFTQTFTDKNGKDRQMPAKLKAEAPGILAWAVQGCLDWQRQGLGEPQSVMHATDAYRSQEDLIGGFINQCCDRSEFLQVKFSEFYDALANWDDVGERPPSKKAVGRYLQEQGFTSEGTRTRSYCGLSLKTT